MPLDLFNAPITLWPHQSKAVEETWNYLSSKPGHPCLVLPTAAGKSVIVAELCKQAVKGWPGTRILMLVGVQELVEQNSEKMLTIWPNAPLGIYSAGLNSKTIDAITFASIQSIYSKAYLLGHLDLVIVDEADTINHKDEGIYRNLIRDLLAINPSLRIIGLTASPWRLGHGLITDKPAIFDDLIEVTTIPELQALGRITNLKSKITAAKLDTEGVHERGGEYIESELQKHVDTDPNNIAVAKEIVQRATEHGRHSWIVFCTGVEHALHMRDVLRGLGIACETVTGKTPKEERRRILDNYKSGRVTAVTNANVLTRGFDAPNTDLIALCRATMSPGLYLQMVGRGFRIKQHTDFCLVLDFAGVIAQHGPITGITIPSKAGEGDGIPPSKTCPECGEIVAASAQVCPSCNYVFPPPKKDPLRLRDDDIMGLLPHEMKVESWSWSVQRSKKSDQPMIVVAYYGGIGMQPIREYLCVWHEGFAAQKAQKRIHELAAGAHVPIEELIGEDGTTRMERAYPPEVIKYKMEGKFPRIVETVWRVEEGVYTEDVPF